MGHFHHYFLHPHFFIVVYLAKYWLWWMEKILGHSLCKPWLCSLCRQYVKLKSSQTFGKNVLFCRNWWRIPWFWIFNLLDYSLCVHDLVPIGHHDHIFWFHLLQVKKIIESLSIPFPPIKSCQVKKKSYSHAFDSNHHWNHMLVSMAKLDYFSVPLLDQLQ